MKRRNTVNLPLQYYHYYRTTTGSSAPANSHAKVRLSRPEISNGINNLYFLTHPVQPQSEKKSNSSLFIYCKEVNPKLGPQPAIFSTSILFLLLPTLTAVRYGNTPSPLLRDSGVWTRYLDSTQHTGSTQGPHRHPLSLASPYPHSGKRTAF